MTKTPVPGVYSPASEQPMEAIGAGREEALHPHAQPFERYPELASHIERMAMSGVIGSLISWEAFLRELNAALSPASPARTPMGGDREHSSRCWGRTSFSDEVLHCYCQTAPTPMGGEVEALREALRLTRERVRDWPLDDHETCMCGSPVEGHDIGSGHSPVSQADHAISLLVESINEALAASSPSPAQGGSRYTTLADLHTIKGWLHGLSTHPDLEDVVADGGVTAGMVYQQEAREFAGRIGRILAAPPSVQPVEGK